MKTLKQKTSLILLLALLILSVANNTFAQSKLSKQQARASNKASKFQYPANYSSADLMRIKPKIYDHTFDTYSSYLEERAAEDDLINKGYFYGKVEELLNSIVGEQQLKGLSPEKYSMIQTKMKAMKGDIDHQELGEIFTIIWEDHLAKKGAQSSLAKSACPSGDVWLTSQEEVDAFGAMGCTQVEGNLWIYNNASLENLDGLSQLTSVGGNLYIMYNSALQNLDGLSNLTSIGGGLYIRNNASLQNLDGLSNLTSIGGDLYIWDNASLQNLDGLSGMAAAGEFVQMQGLSIVDNPLLTTSDFAHFSNLTTVRFSLNIAGLPLLTDLQWLSNLQSVGSYLSIVGNNALQDLAGLSQLTSVGYLDIRGNNNLRSLHGLSGLKEIIGPQTPTCGCLVRWSYIADNASLENLDGLSDLTEVVGNFRIEHNASLHNTTGLSNLSLMGGALGIRHNPSLADIGSFPDLSSVGGALIIEYNPLLTSLNGFSNVSSVGADLIIVANSSLQSLEGLSNISSVGAWLGVHDNASLKSLDGILNIKQVKHIDIINNDALEKIEGFNYLKFLEGSLNVIDNNSLTKIEGFQSLKSISGDFLVLFNPYLKVVEGLSKLSSAGHDVVFYENATLTDMDGLSNLSSVGGWMVIQNLPALKNIDGLANLTRVGELTLAFCPLLQNIDGLSNLSSAGEIFIGYLPSLENIDGLSSLTHVDGLLGVIEMAGLQNIDGLSNVTHVGGDLWVFHNPSLTSCCGIYQLLCADSPACTTDAVGGYIDVGGNGSGCTPADIIAGGPCTPSSLKTSGGNLNISDNFQTIQGISVYPNPAQEVMTIGLGSLTTGSAQVKISNSLGKTLWQQQIDDVREVNQLTVNLKGNTSFEPGLYFVTIFREGDVQTRQVMIQR